jgi:hypothetical protein
VLRDGGDHHGGNNEAQAGLDGPVYIESLRARLLERGYTPGSIKLILTLAGQLGRWMQTADVKFSQLDSAAVASFLDSLRARGVRRVPGPRGLRSLLDYLDSEGALAFKPVPDSPVERLVAEYRIWLVVDRGLAAATVLRYENLARRFLGQQPAADDGQVTVDLTAADVVGFLLRESERVSVGAAKGRVAELRSLLRFLHLKGFTRPRWPARCRRRPAGTTPVSRSGCPPPRCSGCWMAATGPPRPASATSRSSCWWPGWACARSK